MLSIAILITCHNRKEKTLTCLKNLFDQNDLGKEFIMDVYLVDDGSTDGTSEAILSLFPDVNIIKGVGNLYWNRGMHLAWKTASATKDFDYYLWLNDDTFLFDNAINSLLHNVQFNSIIVGSTKSISNDFVTYGGFKNNNLLVSNGKLQDIDYFNGNSVLIPRSVFKLIGNLNPKFHHALGDFDYGLRAKKQGLNIYITPFFVGTCESHNDLPIWRDTKYKLHKRLNYLYKPNSGCNPFEYFYFDYKNINIFIALFHFFTIHIRCFFPKLWSQKK
jgi:GT2 family glycosyltransferase